MIFSRHKSVWETLGRKDVVNFVFFCQAPPASRLVAGYNNDAGFSVHNPHFRRRVPRLWDADPEGLNSGEPTYDVDGSAFSHPKITSPLHGHNRLEFRHGPCDSRVTDDFASGYSAIRPAIRTLHQSRLASPRRNRSSVCMAGSQRLNIAFHWCSTNLKMVLQLWNLIKRTN